MRCHLAVTKRAEKHAAKVPVDSVIIIMTLADIW